MSASHMIGKILVFAIIVLSVVVIFISFIHLYAKWFLYSPSTRSRRGDFTAGHQEEQQSGSGLCPSFLKTLPVIAFDPQDFKQGLECAVCLSEVGEGEKTRILPKCNHGFHVECIDMWFYSHSTCPICRDPVSVETLGNLLESQEEFPTNVLFWGDETQVSTITSQANLSSEAARPDLVIDIPGVTQIDGDEDKKSTVSSRLTSGSRRFINPFSTR